MLWAIFFFLEKSVIFFNNGIQKIAAHHTHTKTEKLHYYKEVVLSSSSDTLFDQEVVVSA